MRKFPILFCFLIICLLTACFAPEATTVPKAPPPPEVPESAPLPARLREEPLPGAASSLLTLAEGDELLDWRAGDLDGDGIDDLALVIERNEEDNTGERFGKMRELAILLGDGPGYVPGQSSRQVLRWSGEGGMNPEPYDGMEIDQGLAIREYGKDWNMEIRFTWQGGGLALTDVVYYSWTWDGEGRDLGMEDRWNLLTGEFTRTGYAETTAPLFQAILELPAPWPLEAAPGAWELEEDLRSAIPPLPVMAQWPQARDATGLLTQTPQEVLEQIHAEYYPELERADFPWTGETRANYSAFLGYPVPECYYTDGQNTLYYFWLESRLSDGDVLSLSHSVWYEDGDGNTEIYTIPNE